MKPALYCLSYRVRGRSAGLVLIEAYSLADAKLRAELEQLDPGGEWEGHELSPTEARAVPRELIGRLLRESEWRKIERRLIASGWKKPAAPSVWRWLRRAKRLAGR